MAFYLSKSRGAMNYLRPRIGSFGYWNCWSASLSRDQTLQAAKINNPDEALSKRPSLLFFCCSESVKAEKVRDCTQCVNGTEVLNFPGGKVKFTSKLDFLPESHEERIQCYWILNDNGQLISSDFVKVTEEFAIRMYTDMVTLQTMDTIFYEAQRQGRISFYVTTIGEEGINVTSAAALHNDDHVNLTIPYYVLAVPTSVALTDDRKRKHNLVSDEDSNGPFLRGREKYREPGVLLWRGFTLQEFANQCFGNKNDSGKGRQMPAHYGSHKHNYFTVASTVASQIPHAVGAAYSLKMDNLNACSMTYFGDGGSSTGDFHAALNFAAVMEAPVILFCRNNGWAISTPVGEQYRSDGIVSRGQAYGVQSIRIDGNDALAIYSAVHSARQIAIREQRPVLIEALTYRAGHHTTSDDSTRYRPAEEMEWWRVAQNPVTRFRKWLMEGWWSPDAEAELRSSLRKQVLHAIQVAERDEKPPVTDIFTDVYYALPSNLREQETSLRQTIERHPEDYP